MDKYSNVLIKVTSILKFFQGIWSADCPTCVPVVCPTLDVKNNLVEIIKQDSGFGGTAIFKCPEGSKLSGVATLVCLATGEWSGKMPSCRGENF